jgi:hypothetical protein
VILGVRLGRSLGHAMTMTSMCMVGQAPLGYRVLLVLGERSRAIGQWLRRA